MVSWDTHKLSSAGNSRLSHPEICSGDQSRAGFSITRHRSSGWSARRHGFGRGANSQARASAPVARYEPRPPWRAASRLTVDGEHPKLAAMRRIDCPAAIPREIASRSSSTSTTGPRQRATGGIPPSNTPRHGGSRPWSFPVHGRYRSRTGHASNLPKVQPASPATIPDARFSPCVYLLIAN